MILNDFYHKESSLFLKAEFIFNFKHKKKRTGHANSKQNLGCALYKSGHVFINFIYVTLKKTFNTVNAILLVALVAMGVLKNKILPVIFPGKQN